MHVHCHTNVKTSCQYSISHRSTVYLNIQRQYWHTLSLYNCYSGPSGIQQRVLEELILTRWDESPPLHSGTQSPTIIIHDSSDSEEDLEPDRTPTVTTSNKECEQSSSAVSMGQVASNVCSASVESCPEVSSTAAIAKVVTLNDEVSSTSGNVDHSESTSLPSSSAVASQPHPELLSHEDDGGDDVDDFEISLYAEDGGASLGNGSTPNSDVTFRARNIRNKATEVRKSKRKDRHNVRTRTHDHREDKSRHSVNKDRSYQRGREREDGGQTSEREGHHRQSKRRRSRSRSNSRNRASRSHRHDSVEKYSSSRHHSRESSYRRRRKQDSSPSSGSRGPLRSKRGDSHRSESRSPLRSSRHSYNSSDDDSSGSHMKTLKSKAVVVDGGRTRRQRDRGKREFGHKEQRRDREKRERSESRSPHRKFSRGEHDYERMSPPCERKHQSGLYSDDSWSTQLPSSSHTHKLSVSHATRTKTGKKDVPSLRDMSKDLSLSDEEKHQRSRMSGRTQQLAQELNEVDGLIQDNKKELLKSMLRKERLELLQKNLHSGGDSTSESEGSLFASSVTQKPTDVATTTTSEMERELELLNRAIVDGKKQLLRVMKKVEEEQIQLDQD